MKTQNLSFGKLGHWIVGVLLVLACGTAKASGDTTSPACSTSYNSAKAWCEGVDVVASLSQIIPQVATGISEGDMKKMCEKSKDLNKLGALANASFGALCLQRALACSRDCDREAGEARERMKSFDSLEAVAEGGQTQQPEVLPLRDCQALYPNKPTAIEQCRNSNVVLIANARTAAKEALDKINEQLGLCGGFKANATKAGLQAVQNALAFGTSQQCLRQIAATECKTQEDLRTKPECRFQMCAPGSQWAGTTDCAGFYALNCEAPENFGNQVCICRANPTDPQCPGVAGNPNDPNNPFGPGGGPGSGPRFGDNDDPNGNGAGGDPFAPGFTDDQLASLLADNDPSNDEFARNALANRNGGGAGSGGTPGSGLQTSPFNPNTAGGRGGGPGRGPYDTNILGAADRDKGSFPSGGGGGAYPFGGGDGKGQSMNLKDFLPGGKGAARAIASQKELEKNGVSDANGLTNFQKVTRKMNDLRAKEQVLKDGP